MISFSCCCCNYKLVQSLWKTIWYYLVKSNIHINYDLAIPLLGRFPRETLATLNRVMSTNIPNSIYYNSKQLEVTQIINRRMGKWIVIYWHYRILKSIENEWTTTCNGLEILNNKAKQKIKVLKDTLYSIIPFI